MIETDHFWITFLTVALISSVVLYCAHRLNFFIFPYKSFNPGVRFTQLITGFGIYLVISLLFFPLLSLFTNNLGFATPQFMQGAKGWMQLLYIVLLFGILYGYFFMLLRPLQQKLFWAEGKQKLKTFFRGVKMGAAAWLVSYPLVLGINLFTTWLGEIIWGSSEMEQVAVTHLRELGREKLLYWLTACSIAILVPMIEEFLFRGLLQSWLKNFVGKIGALFFTALIFSVVHFSPEQGAMNFALICSLFVLSCFLGFIYERESTLWASITLHGLFNATTVILLAF